MDLYRRRKNGMFQVFTQNLGTDLLIKEGLILEQTCQPLSWRKGPGPTLLGEGVSFTNSKILKRKSTRWLMNLSILKMRKLISLRFCQFQSPRREERKFKIREGLKKLSSKLWVKLISTTKNLVSLLIDHLVKNNPNMESTLPKRVSSKFNPKLRIFKSLK